MEDLDLTALAADASRVAATHDNTRIAFDEEADARAVLVRRIIDTVRPALPALCSRPLIGERTFWPDRTCPETETTRADWKGLLIFGDGPEQDYRRANEGSYIGSDIYLGEDGAFVSLDYSGHWSRWQGASSAWEAAATVLDDRTAIDTDERLADFSRTISEKLKAHLDGKSSTRAEAARKRTEKLRAITSLL